MFGFLKNKLKEAIGKFSKKAEEEAKVETTIEKKEEVKPEVKEVEVVQESKGFLGLFKKKKVTESEEVKETIEIKTEEKTPELKKEEKKGFFAKLAEKVTTKK